MNPVLPHGTQHRIDLSAGPVHYETQGDGAVVVFVHGALVDGTLWSPMARELASDYRCIVPTWPLGSHTEPMKPTAELSVTTVAGLVAELLERLDLEDVTLVGNDSGGVVCQLAAVHHPERIARVVLSNCDAFEVFPPKAFEYFPRIPRVPGLLTAMSKEMHLFPSLARMPTAFGDLTSGRLSSATLRRWFAPAAKNRAVRRDLAKLLRSVDRQTTLDVGARLGEFEGEVLLLWGEDDKHFTVELAERLERAFHNARLVRVSGARTFVCLDEPKRCAEEVRRFLAAPSAAPSRGPQAVGHRVPMSA